MGKVTSRGGFRGEPRNSVLNISLEFPLDILVEMSNRTSVFTVLKPEELASDTKAGYSA